MFIHPILESKKIPPLILILLISLISSSLNYSQTIIKERVLIYPDTIKLKQNLLIETSNQINRVKIVIGL
jgi:hypothetical protein